ncbi:DUF6263 family protein [Maribacter halichondriae]|uniref:DUF6263 family protein n=1 Tax=Maribacter halichondriae TaxID=2980554 RepID=UPI002358573E|nr:DUF6263 family protein [Maribacter sp. Hal144]
MRYFVALTFLFLTSALVFSQTKLQYDLEKNSVFEIQQRAEQIITQELDGATHELNNVIDGILEFKVLGEVDGTYEIALTFKDLNLKMTSSIQGELMNVKAKDTTKGDMQSKIFNSLLDNPVSLILAKTGDILEVKGGDSLVAKMAQASGLEDDFSLNMMKANLEKEFGSEALSNNYKQMTFIYSPEAVQVGDSWQNEYMGKLNAKNTWMLTELNKEKVDISGTADVVMLVEEPATTMKLNGTQDTKIMADLTTGFIQKMTVTGTSTGTSTMAQMGDAEIPTTIKSTITYELIKE